MASTTFSGPVNSTNGFSGSVLTAGSSNITTLTSSSATVTNLLCTTLTIGNTKLVQAGSAVSGLVSAQLGYMQVLVGSTTSYIALYKSLTL
jgi:hypothetical protein